MTSVHIEPTFTGDIEAPTNYHTLDDKSDSSWNPDTESYIQDILKKCQNSSEAHTKSGYKFKQRNVYFGLPAVIIPSMAAPIIGTFKDSYWVVYFSMFSMMITAFFSGFIQFFNYAAKSQLHFTYAGRYEDVTTDILEVMSKHANKRQPCGLIMRTAKLKYDTLMLTAPET